MTLGYHLGRLELKLLKRAETWLGSMYVMYVMYVSTEEVRAGK